LGETERGEKVRGGVERGDGKERLGKGKRKG